MNWKRLGTFGVLLLVALGLSISKAAPQPAIPEALSVRVDQAQVGPRIVKQMPMEGQRLDLSPRLQFTFDRDMDREKTANAFLLYGPDRQPLAGQRTWRDARTFEFVPRSRLKPASTYKAIFTTQAIALDGTSPKEDLELHFTTIEALAVAQVFPTAEAEEVDGRTSITVIFNRPVVPLALQEEQSALPQPLEFSPPVAGQGQWVSSSVYVFQPQQPLASNTRYTVRVEAGLKDTSGNTLEAPYIWQFHTRAPMIMGYSLKNGARNPAENIENVLLDQAFEITFLQPMQAQSVAQAVSVLDRETGKPFPIRLKWNKDFTFLTIEPVGRYKVAHFYQLEIRASAQAQDGGTLKDGLTIRFSTVPLPKIIEVQPAPDSVAKDFSARLTLKFASPMKVETLKSRVLITPQPKTELQWYYNDYERTFTTYGLAPATDYVVRILPGMADIYGNTIQNEFSFTFKTGDKQPYARLVLPWTPLVYRALGPQEVYLEYLNLDAVSVSLYPLAFEEFSRLLNQEGHDESQDFVPQSPPIRAWRPERRGPRNQLQRENLKLEDPYGNPLSPGYYLIGVEGSPLEYKGRFYQRALFIVATDNLTFKATPREGLAWLVDLESGEPQAGVPITFYDKDFKALGNASTDRNGLVHLQPLEQPVYARAAAANHVAFTALDWGSGVWAGDFGILEDYYGNTAGLFAYLYTDRPVYRPGQEVYFKGIVRENNDLHYSRPALARVHVDIEREGQPVYSQDLPLSEMSSFSGSFKIDANAALGTYTLLVREAQHTEAFGTLSFRIAEYRKPQFQVRVEAEPDNLLSGEKVRFDLEAAYYSGGYVSGGRVDWFMEAMPYDFQPASQYSAFSFMDWDRDRYASPQQGRQSRGRLAAGQDTLDANGHLEVLRTLETAGVKNAQQVTLHVNVSDVAGEVVGAQTSLIVHPSQVYAGIRSLSYVGQQGREQPFEIVALDWDSNPIAGQSITVKFVERKWFSVQKQDRQGQLRWETSVRDILIGQKTAITDKEGKAHVAFVPPRGGVYKAIVTARDARGHAQQASTYLWVASQEHIAWRQTNDRTFNLVADKDVYSPGETAELLIAQPFEGSVYALVTYERGHIYKQEVILLTGNSTIYKLPIRSDMAPLSYVSVVVVSGAASTQGADFKIGMTPLRVETRQKALDVSVSADRSRAGPGDEVTYTITTRDSEGRPVQADVSLAVVDKAALALAPANSEPILRAFYPEQALGVRTALGLTVNAEEFNAQYRESIPEGGGSGGGGAGESLGIITTRQDFKDTAFFQGQVTTDEKGQARLSVRLPQNLTTWVADVRAATEEARVGQATHELVSTKPLFIELQTPRFFLAGDRARLGAVIHNNGSDPLKVQVSLEAQGLTLTTPSAQSAEVPPHAPTYVTWDGLVQAEARRVDLTAHVRGGPYQDASKPPLATLPAGGIPVYHYEVVETSGTAGMLASAGSITEGIQLPSTLDYEEASLSIEVAPSLTASLRDGLSYLQDYPYLCIEQTVSRFLPNVIAARALRLAGREHPQWPNNLEAQINSALQRIYARQKADGGWSWWDGPESDLQTSAYVVFGLLEARENGYAVAESVLANGIRYLKDNLPTLKRNDAAWQFNRHAFVLYVLARAGELGAGQTNFLYEHRASLSLYGKAYLAQAIHLLDAEDARLPSLISDLETAALTSAAGRHWEEAAPDERNWNTDTRTTAIVLNALVQVDPNNPLNAAAVRWLVSNRRAGHWDSTQETAWALIALTNWMNASKENEAHYAYAVGLNGDLLQEGRVAKENLATTVRLQVPFKDLLKEALNYLVFTRGGGPGHLYYTAYLNTTLPVEAVAARDQGLSLARQYFTLDNSQTPIRSIRRGEIVRVRLTLIAPASLHYVVIDDPLPAGLEAIDASISTDIQVPSTYSLRDYTERGWGWWYFNHVELRDEKVVLSADYLPAGTYVYTYLARAGTVGEFKVRPPTAFEFYFPEVSGRGAGSIFTVQP